MDTSSFWRERESTLITTKYNEDDNELDLEMDDIEMEVEVEVDDMTHELEDHFDH